MSANGSYIVNKMGGYESTTVILYYNIYVLGEGMLRCFALYLTTAAVEHIYVLRARILLKIVKIDLGRWLTDTLLLQLHPR